MRNSLRCGVFAAPLTAAALTVVVVTWGFCTGCVTWGWPAGTRVVVVAGGLVALAWPLPPTAGAGARVAGGAPRPVRIDGDALAQILGNLLGNVEKYAPAAPVQVETAQEPGRVRIAVDDGGPGIPDQARDRVFEPFVRLGNAAHEAVPGTGIGLGIARDLARLHGGDLRCLPGSRGARFELTLAVEEIT